MDVLRVHSCQTNSTIKIKLKHESLLAGAEDAAQPAGPVIACQSSQPSMGMTDLQQAVMPAGDHVHGNIAYRGVYHDDGGSFSASITVFGSNLPLGVFDNPADAAKAYDLAALALYDTSAVTNFPMEGYGFAEVARMKQKLLQEHRHGASSLSCSSKAAAPQPQAQQGRDSSAAAAVLAVQAPAAADAAAALVGGRASLNARAGYGKRVLDLSTAAPAAASPLATAVVSTAQRTGSQQIASGVAAAAVIGPAAKRLKPAGASSPDVSTPAAGSNASRDQQLQLQLAPNQAVPTPQQLQGSPPDVVMEAVGGVRDQQQQQQATTILPAPAAATSSAIPAAAAGAATTGNKQAPLPKLFPVAAAAADPAPASQTQDQQEQQAAVTSSKGRQAMPSSAPAAAEQAPATAGAPGAPAVAAAAAPKQPRKAMRPAELRLLLCEATALGTMGSGDNTDAADGGGSSDNDSEGGRSGSSHVGRGRHRRKRAAATAPADAVTAALAGPKQAGSSAPPRPPPAKQNPSGSGAAGSAAGGAAGTCYRGIILRRNGRYDGRLTVLGVKLYLGVFNDPADAAAAYDLAALALYEAAAATNFPREHYSPQQVRQRRKELLAKLKKHQSQEGCKAGEMARRWAIAQERQDQQLQQQQQKGGEAAGVATQQGQAAAADGAPAAAAAAAAEAAIPAGNGKRAAAGSSSKEVLQPAPAAAAALPQKSKQQHIVGNPRQKGQHAAAAEAAAAQAAEEEEGAAGPKKRHRRSSSAQEVLQLAAEKLKLAVTAARTRPVSQRVQQRMARQQQQQQEQQQEQHARTPPTPAGDGDGACDGLYPAAAEASADAVVHADVLNGLFCLIEAAACLSAEEQAQLLPLHSRARSAAAAESAGEPAGAKREAHISRVGGAVADGAGVGTLRSVQGQEAAAAAAEQSCEQQQQQQHQQLAAEPGGEEQAHPARIQAAAATAGAGLAAAGARAGVAEGVGAAPAPAALGTGTDAAAAVAGGVAPAAAAAGPGAAAASPEAAACLDDSKKYGVRSSKGSIEDRARASSSEGSRSSSGTPVPSVVAPPAAAVVDDSCGAEKQCGCRSSHRVQQQRAAIKIDQQQMPDQQGASKSSLQPGTQQGTQQEASTSTQQQVQQEVQQVQRKHQRKKQKKAGSAAAAAAAGQSASASGANSPSTSTGAAPAPDDPAGLMKGAGCVSHALNPTGQMGVRRRKERYEAFIATPPFRYLYLGQHDSLAAAVAARDTAMLAVYGREGGAAHGSAWLSDAGAAAIGCDAIRAMAVKLAKKEQVATLMAQLGTDNVLKDSS